MYIVLDVLIIFMFGLLLCHEDAIYIIYIRHLILKGSNIIRIKQSIEKMETYNVSPLPPPRMNQLEIPEL